MSKTLTGKTQFYHHLYAGYQAGLPLVSLLQGAILPIANNEQAERLQAGVEKGRSMSAALAAQKPISPWEAKLLAIGESSGRIEAVLRDLELFFENRSAQLREIKSKLVYPLLVLGCSIVVPPLPQVAAGILNPFHYLLSTLAQLFFIWFAYLQLLILPFEKASAGAFNPVLLKALTLVGPSHLLREIFEISYLNLLTICLESGLDAAETLRLMKDSSNDKAYRLQHQHAVSDVQKYGYSLTRVLTGNSILRHPQVISFLYSSEQSGTLHSALREFIARKKIEHQLLINFHVRRIGQWFYIGALIYVALGIL